MLGVVVTGSAARRAAPVQQGINLPGAVPLGAGRARCAPSASRGGKVIVHLEVIAPGVAEPDGTVVIKVGDRERTVTVKKGKAIARFLGLPPGPLPGALPVRRGHPDRGRARPATGCGSPARARQQRRQQRRQPRRQPRRQLSRTDSGHRRTRWPHPATRPAGFCCGAGSDANPRRRRPASTGVGHPVGRLRDEVGVVRAHLTLAAPRIGNSPVSRSGRVAGPRGARRFRSRSRRKSSSSSGATGRGRRRGSGRRRTGRATPRRSITRIR